MPNIKDLFKKHDSSGKVLSAKNISELTSSKDAESLEHIQAYQKEKDRFFPEIDFSKPETFVRYGSAERYYEDAITSTYRMYPYDGSKKEKIEWHNSSSYFDNYVFDNLYPRTNGYLNFFGMNTPQVFSLTVGAEIIRKGTGGQYVYVKGGPNKAGVADDQDQTLAQKFNSKSSKTSYTETSANIFDADKKRASNFAMNGVDGNTIETWIKRSNPGGGIATFSAPTFDLWNSDGTAATAIGSASYGRFLIESRVNTGTGTPFDGANFHLTYMSGTAGAERVPILFLATHNMTAGEWYHIAVSVKNSGNSLNIKTYLNGELADNILTGSAVQEVTGAMNANIGAYKHYPTDAIKNAAIAAGITATTWDGGGAITGSIDEFRFWKTARTSQDIGRNWFSQVYGGSNTDDANTDLGVYFKFNEGITGEESYDSTALDYSGRISNGQIINYTASMRETGSAMVEASAAASEFKDPIIYSFHPDVKALLDDKKAEGSVYDATNASAMHTTIPTWMGEDDKEVGASNLVKLMQIMASYFDTLQLQLDFLPRMKDAEYTKFFELKAKKYSDEGSIMEAGSDYYPAFSSSFSGKPQPFTKFALQSLGIEVPEIFTDANALEQFRSRDEQREYKDKLYNVKNQIYQNVYNNLHFILKSKGTEKAFRNLIRCYGVDDELVRLNLYGNNVDFELKNNFRSTAVKRTYVDFMDVDRQAATVYMMTSSVNNNTNAYSYIPSNSALVSGGFGMTFQTEVYFPDKGEEGDTFYQPFEQLTSSLYGVHTAIEAAAGTSGQSNTTWNSPDVSEFKVYAVRPESKSPHAYFQLTSSVLGINLTSSVFDFVYDNEKWNFAVRIKPTKYPWANALSGTNSGSLATGVAAETDLTYEVSFYGAHADLDVIVDEFDLSTTINASLGDNFMSGSKRVYIGAHRTNFTGALLQESDVRISSTRAWMDYLTKDELRAHARDADNKGVLHPYKNAFVFQESVNQFDIPRSELLIFEWDYTNVTSSDAGISGTPTVYDARFVVEDISSGSTSQNFADWITDNRYGSIGNIVRNQYTGRGDFFEPSNDQVVDHIYIHSAKQDGPEVINSSDMIEILNQDDLEFTRESRPIDYFYAVEKSMYQTISDEMLRMFATIADFNNLIGEPVNRYRGRYKDMEKLKSLFFESIGNSPDLDNYVEFYKWLDSSITRFLEQLFPASANYSEDLRTLVENHVLERNAYRNKFPTLEIKQPEPEVPILGINELTYNWKFGHAPIPEASTGRHATGTQECLPIFSCAVTTPIVFTSTSNAFPVTSAAQRNGEHIQINVIAAAANPTNTILVGFVSIGTPRTQININITPNDGTNNGGTPVDLTSAEFVELINNGSVTGKNVTITDSSSVRTMQTATGGDGTNLANGGEGDSSRATFSGGINFGDDSRNCTWWNQRAERTTGNLSSSVASVNADRQAILDRATTDNSGSYLTKYQGSTYVLRKLSKPYKEGVSFSKQFKGGVNFDHNKKVDYWKGLFVKGTNNNMLVSGHTLFVDDAGKEDRHCIDGDDTNTLSKNKIKTYVDIDKNDDGTATSPGAETIKANTVLPFSIYSSPSTSDPTVTTTAGYVNIHHDGYGSLAEVPMQGPFSEKYEGGNQHRHFRLNDGTNTTLDRPEAWNYTTNNTILRRNSDIHSDGIDAPYYRDFIAKRPVVIKNILQTTASGDTRLNGALFHGPIGNYSHQHDVVQTSGRKTNNKYFVEQEGVGFGHVITDLEASPEISSVIDKYYDFQLRDNKTTDTVFVERFSAPGSYEAMSRGYLDPFAEEMSVYNAMPFRNLSVRGFGSHQKQARALGVGVEMSASTWHTSSLGLNSLYSRHTLFGGVDYEAQTEGAFHKTYRNKLRRLEQNGSVTTGSVFDNAFVSHMIPRSDFQYSWITASVLSTDMSNAFGFGYFPYSGEVSSSAGGFESAVNFVSASDVGVLTTNMRFGVSRAGTGGNFLPVDFVGLNTIVVADSNAFANNTITGDTTSPTTPGLNTAIVPGFATPGPGVPDGSAFLNATILNAGGATGYSTFRQIRNMYHPIARHLGNTNTYSISVRTGKVPVSEGGFPLDFGIEKVFPKLCIQGVTGKASYENLKGMNHALVGSETTIQNYTEPPLSSKFKPLRHKLTTIDDNQQVADISLDHTYTNNYDYFANPTLMNKMNTANKIGKTPRQVYDNLLDYTVKGTVSEDDNPIKGIKNLVYKETIYPKERHTYLAKSRGRTSYSEDIIATSYTASLGQQRTFWRESLTKRQRTSGVARSILGSKMDAISLADPDYGAFPTALSVWGLDTGTRVTSATNKYFSLSGSGHGELSIPLFQQSMTQYQKSSDYIPTASFAYEYHNFISASSAEAPNMISDFIPDWDTERLSGKSPWFDSYEQYAADIRLIGQEYTVLPEFRITEHMDYYLDNGFFEQNNKFLTLEGAELSQSAETETSAFDSEFYNVYSHSDFLKHFQVIREQHDEVLDQTIMTVKCNAVKKLLPYNGFYPVNRTIQLGNLMSESFGPYLVGSSLYSGNKSERVASLMQPFFNPGILYNTIKSGLAVDWLTFTGSARQQMAHGGGDVIYSESGSFRFPFESLISPQNYLPTGQQTYRGDDNSRRIAFIDTMQYSGSAASSPQISGAYAEWLGKNKENYSLAINNFLAEVPNFFLEDKKFSSISSSPIASFVSGVVYTMDLDIYKTDDTVMYEGPNAITGEDGTTKQARGMHYGPTISHGISTSADRYDPAYAPWTPPYFYGRSTVRFTFEPHKFIELDPNETINVGGADSTFKMSEIVSYIAVSGTTFFNKFDLDDSGKLVAGISNLNSLSPVDNTNTDAYATKYQMQANASMNLFNVVDGPATALGENSRWVISPKFECPVLNFSGNVGTTFANNNYHTRGMWRGYGAFPNAGQGIYYNLRDTEPTLKAATHNGDPVGGVPRSPTARSVNGSLREKLFSSSQPARIGNIADQKEIFEAIVAVPFKVEGDKKVFIPLVPAVDPLTANEKGRQVVNGILGTGDPLPEDEYKPGFSIIEQVQKMQKYVFPPSLDFINNENIGPIQMYIFEFNHVLDKQDLADIWQGVMPKISVKAEEQTSTITHYLVNNELLLGRDITDDLRWMVFKVKQRAKYSYANLIEETVGSGKQRDKKKYSYNWPYDFFSLVELAKIDVDVQLGGEVPVTPPSIVDPTNFQGAKPPKMGGIPNRTGDARTTADIARDMIDERVTEEAGQQVGALTPQEKTDILNNILNKNS